MGTRGYLTHGESEQSLLLNGSNCYQIFQLSRNCIRG
jgi:hypothetical protein